MTAFGGLAGQAPVLDAPDITVSVRQTFGIDSDLEVPAFSVADAWAPLVEINR